MQAEDCLPRYCLWAANKRLAVNPEVCLANVRDRALAMLGIDVADLAEAGVVLEGFDETP